MVMHVDDYFYEGVALVPPAAVEGIEARCNQCLKRRQIVVCPSGKRSADGSAIAGLSASVAVQVFVDCVRATWVDSTVVNTTRKLSMDSQSKLLAGRGNCT